MKIFEYTIKDELGIHARPAGQLIKLSKDFQSTITLKKDDKSFDAKKLFSVMGANIKCGDAILIEIDGEDEEIAYENISTFFKENL